jgi:prolyl oligopeptidase
MMFRGMERRRSYFLFPILVLALMTPAGAGSTPAPETKKGDVVEDYFGTKIADPYRWLENLDSPETTEWVTRQNQATFAYLEKIPARDPIRRRLTDLWNYPKTGIPFREAGKLFFTRNTGLQKQSVVFRQDSLAAQPAMLIDPNTFSTDGSIALAGYTVSPTGDRFAYERSEGGSDWTEIRIREMGTGKELDDRLKWVKFSSQSWTKDGKGFYYSRYPQPPAGKELESATINHRLYYHVAGTDQDKDRLVFELKDRPEWLVFGGVSEDGRYLIVYVAKGTDPKNELYLADLKDPKKPDLAAEIRPFIVERDAAYVPLGIDGGKLFIQTDLDAPRRRIIAVDLKQKGRDHWKTVIPEAKDVIQSSLLAGGRLAVHYLADVKSQISLFGTDGRKQRDLELPGIGNVAGLMARNDTPELFYAFTSFLMPTTVFRCDLATGKSVPFAKSDVAFDPSGYETRQVFYASKDGTRVPMFITARKGAPRDGSNPTLMYAYGGFDISVQPFFAPSIALWLEMGGVLAVPNLRGGGEYGEDWHRAGMLEKKQNVFDDFLAAADYLITEKITSTGKLAIQGGSNGGLLVGAAMTQRPDLFGVALPEVGVLDMLRFHKFSAGVFWVTEYGSSDDEKQFRTLLAYSPLHRIKPGTCYPATLVTTADHDDRVVPSHSFKFTATLQAAQSCDRPVLIRVETQASHGYSPTDKRIAEIADVYTFAAENLGMALPASLRGIPQTQ